METPEAPPGGSPFPAIAIGLAVAGIAAATIWMRGGSPSGPAPGTPGATATGAAGASAAAPPPPRPAGPDIPATREACLAFLLDRARATGGAPGDIDTVVELRLAAIEALATRPAAEWAPVLDAILGGDGDEDDWTEGRLLGARASIAYGSERGREVLKRFVAQDSDDLLWDSDAFAAAAEAAALLPPPDAGRILARLLAEELEDDLDDEQLARVCRAAAVANAPDTDSAMRRILADEDTWGVEPRAAAAGALLRRGDASGEALLASIEAEDDAFDGEDFALGIAARGNAEALPWLRRLAIADEDFARPVVIRVLGDLGVPAAKEDLRRALEDPERGIRHEAGIALVRMGDETGLPAARAAAREGADADIRERALRALAEAGDAGSRDLAASILAEPLPENLPENQAKRNATALLKVWAARLVVGSP